MPYIAALDFDSINITDDLMFHDVFSDPERCRKLLERLLSMRIKKVVITSTEKTLVPWIDAHGIRMDVYSEGCEGTVYDVEMQASREGDLALRSRYYQSTIDGDLLKKGLPYRELRQSFVIFVCTYDPFGAKLPRYTFVPRCLETDLELSDHAARVFINASAWERCENASLRSFLHYLKSGIMEQDDDFLYDVDAAVRKARESHEWRTRRMNWEQYIMDKEYAARAEGIAEGKAERSKELSALAAALREAGRTDEFWSALDDANAAQTLFAEFGIGQDTSA